MEIRQILIHYLCTYSKAKINLSELEEAISIAPELQPRVLEDQFAHAILAFETEGILEPVKAHGRTGKRVSLAYQYRIHKSKLQEEYFRTLHQIGATLHKELHLATYYGLHQEIFQSDLPYIKKIDAFLKTNDWPKIPAPAPERSYELVQDEKWITDRGGHAVLERLGLVEKMNMIPVSDPLMFAINPKIPSENEHQRHLIVENKTTFQALMTDLPSLPFTTVIYGSGRKIVGNLDMLPYQYPVKTSSTTLYYFGDLDREGIAIWHDLHKKFHVHHSSQSEDQTKERRNQGAHFTLLLAIPFYRACLAKTSTPGKQNQRKHELALQAFTSQFPENDADKITSMLLQDHYIPQETLKREELVRIERNLRGTSRCIFFLTGSHGRF
nr:hypothetical protein [Bacilli bacterium]